MATSPSLVPNNSNKTSPETNTPMIVLGNTKSKITINLKLPTPTQIYTELAYAQNIDFPHYSCMVSGASVTRHLLNLH
jgi:hypothetical protein